MAALYTDHNVARALARLLQARGHAVTTAHDLGLDGASDDEHLLVAAQRGWTLITNNRDDFVLLHNPNSPHTRAVEFSGIETKLG